MLNLLKWFIFFCILVAVINWAKNAGKYEGQTAQYWFERDDNAEVELESMKDRYNNLKECLSQSSYIGDFGTRIIAISSCDSRY